EEVAVNPPAPRQAAVHLPGEEVGPAVQPALALHEVKEEDPGELEQREAVPLGGARPRGEGGGHAVERGPEGAKEGAPHRLAVEGAGRARRVGERAAL